MSKRIGYVDYRLDNFHADIYLRHLRGELASRGYQVAGATAIDQPASIEWCDKNEVKWFDNVEQLGQAVDCMMVLAPSNPECHLELCEQVFPLGMPTFVDKTFAPDLATAQEIFDLADQHNVAIQTASALRSTEVQAAMRHLKEPLKSMSAVAGGASWEEYGIHPIEMVVSCLGPDAEQIMWLGEKDSPTIFIRFSDVRLATIQFNAKDHVPFSAMLTTDREIQHCTVDDQQLFVSAASAILDFFDAGHALVDRKETMAILAVLQLALRSDTKEKWCDVFNGH